MLKYAIIFAIVSLIAGALGFTGVAAGAAGIAKILFFIFLAIAVLFVILAVLAGLVTEVVAADVDADAIRRHLDVALDAFGPARLMFGSDWPVCLLRAEHAQVVRIVDDWAARLSADERAQLWGGTAARCYGLDP